MKTRTTPVINRRRFLIRSLQAGAGLTLAIHLPGFATDGYSGASAAADKPFKANAFVEVTPENRVIVMIKHLEMGQGVFTGLATLVAEEMDAAWDQIEPRHAPANAQLYNNLFWGEFQGTGGSTAIANSFEQMRKAGATARQMLVQAAARRWGVPAKAIRVDNGVVRHEASDHRASFGELAADAAWQTPPEPDSLTLKKPSQFNLIGHEPLPRKDEGKTAGKAIFTQDIQQPGQLTAVVAHPPRFGATIKHVDSGASKKIPGVKAVVSIPNGVAVVATDFWSAQRGRDKLQIEWDTSAAFNGSSDALLKDYRALAQKPGAVAASRGDVAAGFERAGQVVEAQYEFPYLAHATMEPMNCVVQAKADTVQIWNGCQLQTGDQAAVAKLFGIAPEKVTINTVYAGGSFGRRANPAADYVLEAAHIVKQMQTDVPIKLVWTREDDTRAGFYRPMYVHKLKAGLDDAGNIIAWQHRIVGQSILTGTPFGGMIKNGIDPTSVEGAANLPYQIPNFQVELHTTENPVPVLWWRSVGSTHTAYATETFIDQLAHKAGADPLEFRLAMLKQHPRHATALELAATRAGWRTPLPDNHFRGLAVHESFDSYVAQVVEVSRQPDNKLRLEKISCAVDCGIAVNPDIIRAQMEGGIAFGLAAALFGEISLENGAVQQSNFHDYEVLRMRHTPPIDVHIVPSAAAPTGVGEPGTPVVAPALGNALFQMDTALRERLPLKLALG